MAVQQSVAGSDTAEGFRVCLDVGGGKGKGLVATRSWEADEEILRESPYVAVQSPESRKHVLACANCFRFVGAPTSSKCSGFTTVHPSASDLNHLKRDLNHLNREPKSLSCLISF